MDQAHARRTDPSTSHEAAASLDTDELRISQAVVLEVIRRYGPMTDENLVTYHKGLATRFQSPSGLRTRRKELVEKRLVHDTGQRKKLRSGRQAIVWGYGPPKEDRPVTQSEQEVLFP